MDGVFSSHVTGNFVMFAVALVQGIEPEDYLKLATFPVFVLAVICTSVFLSRRKRSLPHTLLPATLCMLLIAILATAGALIQLSTNLGELDMLLTLMMVFALGSQNTLHHFLPGPLTTVMTGTVMRTTAILTQRLLSDTDNTTQRADTKLAFAMIVSFTLGCILGGYSTVSFGLMSSWIPALILVWMVVKNRAQRAKPDALR
jgi:uncharacterized membrane protein YoaK (UPF0700 family)